MRSANLQTKLDASPIRLFFATNSRDRGSTSRTLEAWARLMPPLGVLPLVTVGGEGPLLSALRQAGVPVHQHNIRPVYDPIRPWRFLSAIASLALRMRRARVHLVHLNEHEHYPVVARAAFLAGIPAVVHVRFRPTPEMCRWLFKPPYTPARIFFTSKTQMHDAGDAVAEAVPRDRFRLIYNGLDLDVFGQSASLGARLRHEWGIPPDTLVLGTASSISPRKRLDHFIRLVVNLANAGVAVRGFIAGQPYFEEDRRELRALHELVNGLAASHLITFLGYVEPSEPLYHAWDVCVSTSAYETFGMTVLEAMACGCPVIAYSGGSISEVVGEAGTIVPAGDEQQLLETSRRFVDPQQRVALSDRARSRASAFDIKHVVGQLVAEYRAVLNRN